MNSLNRYALVYKDGLCNFWSVGGTWSTKIPKIEELLSGQQADAMKQKHTTSKIVDVIVYLQALEAYNFGVNKATNHEERSTAQSRLASQQAGIASMLQAGFPADALEI